MAEALSAGRAIRVIGDLTETSVRERARLVVSRKLTGFDLTSAAVPIDVDFAKVSTVVAAVAGGPHSVLSAQVAERLGSALSVQAMIACAYRDEESRDVAVSTIERLHAIAADVEYRLVETPDVEGLIAQLPPQAMLVLGAPGGSWLQRNFFGPGVRLQGETEGGTVVVRAAPARVFQHMSDPIFVGPLREASDIVRMHTESVLAVVDRARLVGLVHRERLIESASGVVVGSLMSEPESVAIGDAVATAVSLADRFGGSPIPVTDDKGLMVGSFLP